MSNRYLFSFGNTSLGHNLEYKITEAHDINSGSFALQVDILPHNTSPHLIVVGLAVCIEVSLAVVI